MVTSDLIEQERLKLQENIDAAKMHHDRNRLGQFATPSQLATEMLQYTKSLLPSDSKIQFLDPAFGTGAFYSALLNVFPSSLIAEAVGIEIDQDYGSAAKQLWCNEKLQVRISNFVQTPPSKTDEERFNLIICNPPYVRHQHLETQEKLRLNEMVKTATGIKLSGLAGLYCYFLLLSHSWMAKRGLAGWLIPSEFMDVNYGRQVKEYLLNHVTLLRIHRFNPSEVQFDDALVSSAVVWLEKSNPPSDHSVEFTYGGTLLKPATSGLIPITRLKQLPKWSRLPLISSNQNINQTTMRLGDFFKIKRGIATGANSFFVLTQEQAAKLQIPPEFLIPVLPPPRYLNVDVIEADREGNPVLDQKSFLLSCKLPEEIVRTTYPPLWNYLQYIVKQKINERYICRHRSPWYSQENRPPAPLLFNIMGRPEGTKRRPYRFILNRSLATATNVYLMLYPKPNLKEMIERDPNLLDGVWRTLNDIALGELLREGRVYGGGLYKLEPNELGHVASGELIKLLLRSHENKRTE